MMATIFLSEQEMKRVTGGYDDGGYGEGGGYDDEEGGYGAAGRKKCNTYELPGECIMTHYCSTDAYCQQHYGSKAKCDC